ncbi:MAG: helix-turn-helix domain-containing protein [Bacteroidales bacterium]|nr:helix-turn-helix domain-containing protein [Bacteroidales bacterium]MCM1146866.1 helix-turn-helix domain-containing protein [Bacteroidales bacterium]MCM1205636.1 helix-turn-helix domain-containing protein [Bacillota bacterium]MCM1510252.1 helix-turn-helix domain-containing protein [Clostridium sp.]
MKELTLLPVSIRRFMQYCEPGCHLDEDLVLTDFTEFPLPGEARKMYCVLAAVCTGGEGRYTLGTVEYKVKPNDVIIVAEGQVLGDIKTSDDFRGKALLISHDYLYSVIREVRDVSNLFVISRNRPVISLTQEEVAMFQEYLTQLKSKVGETGHKFRRQVVGMILAAMIYDFCNIITDEQPATSLKSQETFETFIRMVEGNFRHERRISWYSEQLGVSPKTLLEVVKRVSSRTPSEWLDIYTTLEIRLLLRHTAKPIGKIAEDLHFSTQSALGKFFKEQVGMSPNAYRHSDG